LRQTGFRVKGDKHIQSDTLPWFDDTGIQISTSGN
jgi:hypothetical protein